MDFAKELSALIDDEKRNDLLDTQIVSALTSQPGKFG
jgi:hypothetical protein